MRTLITGASGSGMLLRDLGAVADVVLAGSTGIPGMGGPVR